MSIKNTIEAKQNYVKRWLILGCASMAILLTAGSCSFPGLGGDNVQSLGLLKRDPSIRDDGFGRVNAVETISGEVVPNGLLTLSGLRLKQVSRDSFVYLTSQKGLFYTDDGGRLWRRTYIFPVGSDASDENERNNQINEQIAVNDSFRAADVAVDSQNDSTWYVTGLFQGFGKVFKTTNKGETFQEVYSEVEEGVGVAFITVDPRDNNNVLAMLEEGAVIASRDAGRTWQKIRNFDDTPTQIGFIEEFDNLLYVVLENEGIYTSGDSGVTWSQLELTKEVTEVSDNTAEDETEADFNTEEGFGSFEKLIPVTAEPGRGYVLIADGQIWKSPDFATPFSKVLLPLQGEEFNLLDAQPDPNLGLNRFYISIDNRLFISDNQGQSWSSGDLIGLSTPIGDIGEIVFDTDQPEIVYLMLVAEGSSRQGGFFTN